MVRLADVGVDVVEAYTAPFAAVLLAVGVWALRRSEISTTRALGPGVTLALLPSLPQALDEPASLRGQRDDRDVRKGSKAEGLAWVESGRAA